MPSEYSMTYLRSTKRIYIISLVLVVLWLKSRSHFKSHICLVLFYSTYFWMQNIQDIGDTKTTSSSRNLSLAGELDT